jgi:hypothetical protein
MRWGAVGVIASVLVLLSSTPVAALAIQGQLSAFATGPDNTPHHGGGNIEAVFDAAARLWEETILDDVTVTIDFGWQDGPGPLGFSFGDSRTGSIFIPNVHDWFVDATPETSEEYTTPEIAYATLDGIAVNYGSGFTGGLGAAGGYDLFTILLHEIGHVLAFGPDAFADYADGDVDVTAPRPVSGLSIPVANGCCHVAVPDGYTGVYPLLFPFVDVGERRFISDADLLFVAQGGGWERLDPSRFAAVPEPGTLTLLGLGTIGMIWRRRARTSPRS